MPTIMPTPPEVIFDRYIRNCLPLVMRESYKGRLDLEIDLLSEYPEMRDILVAVQEGAQQQLRDTPEKPGEVPFQPIHLDFINSADVNAMAFRYEGFSFIGITLGLVVKLLKTCVQLADSEYVFRGFLAGISEPAKRIHIVRLCQSIQLNFVIWHEFAHIIHGHTPVANADSTFADEIGNEGQGRIEFQAQEVDADSYATWVIINGMLIDPSRQQTANNFGLQSAQPELQDLTFFAAFVLSVGSYFYLRPPAIVDEVGVYNRSHPPQAARMHFVMDMAAKLTKGREHIVSRMNIDRFRGFMETISTAIHGAEGVSNWDSQNAFFRSEQGVKYITELDESYKNLFPPEKMKTA
jgi:hypothetical protein